MHSSFEQHILEQARAGKLPGVFRRLEPEEGSIHCSHHLNGDEKTPDHCLRVVNPGDFVAGYTTCEKYSEWSDEERRGAGGGDGHPDCLHCEVKNIAEGLIQDLRDGKPTGDRSLNDVELVLSGYVDVSALDKEVYHGSATNPFIVDEWIEAFFFIWQTEVANFDIKHLAGPSGDVGEIEGVIGKWMLGRRKRGQALADEALVESRKGGEYGRGYDKSSAALLIHLIEMTGTEVPAEAMRFLEGFADTPEYRLKCLIWQKGWMEHMSKPGPKMTFRHVKTGIETEMPYPEESQKQAVADLARIEQEIEKLQAELSR